MTNNNDCWYKIIIMKLNGDMLRDARDRKGLTQGEVAEALKMSIATVNAAENGKDINPGTGKRICDFLTVDLAEAVIPRIGVGVTDSNGGDNDVA